jgi:hypothetical protein
MRIKNVRLGHACNSSSSHSIIRVNKKIETDETSEFGWDFFTAASTEAKSNYVSSLVKATLDSIFHNDNTRKAILDKLELPDSNGYVDHQSVSIIPTERHTTQAGTSWDINYQFVEELKKFYLQEDIVILGGNDNTDQQHHLLTTFFDISLNLPLDTISIGYKARKDGDWWTIYNRASGDRITMSFEENPKEDKPKFPFLVDIKITDKCGFECDFCYQGSTKKGKDSNKFDCYNIIRELSNLGVFEIAIGGGEVTQSKDNLIKWIHEAYACDITPNFTTKSTSWLSDPEITQPVIEKCGMVAFSVNESFELNQILQRTNKYNLPKGKIGIQVIDEVISKHDLRTITETCRKEGLRLTVLGFKENHRGADFKRQDSGISDLFDWLADNYMNISVDTAFLNKYKKLIQEAKVDQRLYHTEEGIYSCYIDAVEGTIAQSSYSGIPVKIDGGFMTSINETFIKI